MVNNPPIEQLSPQKTWNTPYIPPKPLRGQILAWGISNDELATLSLAMLPRPNVPHEDSGWKQSSECGKLNFFEKWFGMKG